MSEVQDIEKHALICIALWRISHCLERRLPAL